MQALRSQTQPVDDPAGKQQRRHIHGGPGNHNKQTGKGGGVPHARGEIVLTRQRLGGGSPTPRPAAIRAAGGFVVGLQTSPHIPQGPSGAEGKSRRAAGLGAAGPIHTPGLRRALMLLGAGMGSGARAGAAIGALLSNPERRNTQRGAGERWGPGMGD